MINFMKFGEDSYFVYKNGKRLNSIPLDKEELVKMIEDIKLSDDEVIFIERFYGKENEA